MLGRVCVEKGGCDTAPRCSAVCISRRTEHNLWMCVASTCPVCLEQGKVHARQARPTCCSPLTKSPGQGPWQAGGVKVGLNEASLAGVRVKIFKDRVLGGSGVRRASQVCEVTKTGVRMIW